MEIILILPVLVMSVVLHEYAHGWMAKRQGDNTAELEGRLTLNPIPHLDLFGSLIFPVILYLSHAPMLGWAKPVPVNPANFRNYRRGDILVSLAGIFVNLILALLSTLFIIALVNLARAAPDMGRIIAPFRAMAELGLVINLVLAFFNLIPIPPLDGSHVLYHLLPPQLGQRYREIGRYGVFILLGIMMFARNVLETMLWPVYLLQGWAQSLIRLWT